MLDLVRSRLLSSTLGGLPTYVSLATRELLESTEKDLRIVGLR